MVKWFFPIIYIHYNQKFHRFYHPFNCTPAQAYQRIRAQLRVFYFNNRSDFDIDYDDYMPLLSDINFVYDAVRAVKLHALKAKGKGFFYQ